MDVQSKYKRQHIAQYDIDLQSYKHIALDVYKRCCYCWNILIGYLFKTNNY